MAGVARARNTFTLSIGVFDSGNRTSERRCGIADPSGEVYAVSLVPHHNVARDITLPSAVSIEGLRISRAMPFHIETT